jgi:hypothetical protein
MQHHRGATLIDKSSSYVAQVLCLADRRPCGRQKHAVDGSASKAIPFDPGEINDLVRRTMRASGWAGN